MPSELQAYDVMMVVVLLAATVWGAWKGFAWQVASLAAIGVSYFAAYRFREPVAEFIDVAPPWNLFLAMLLVYLGTSFAIWLVFRFVSEVIDRIKLKDFDRQLGAILGAAKGLTLCLIITLFALTLLGESERRHIVGSRSGKYLAQILSRSEAIMPAEVREVLDPYLETVDEQFQDVEPPPASQPETPPPAKKRRLWSRLRAEIRP